MSRLRRAWAWLQPLLTMPDWRDDKIERLQCECLTLRALLDETQSANLSLAKCTQQDAALIASLRASLEDARRQHAITSARVQSLERVLQTIIDNASDGIAEGLDP